MIRFDGQIALVTGAGATRMMTRRVGPGTLRPEDVAPGVAFLASGDCAAFGVVLRAADGSFSVGHYAVNAGVTLSKDDLTPEAVAASWSAITAGPFEKPGG